MLSVGTSNAIQTTKSFFFKSTFQAFTSGTHPVSFDPLLHSFESNRTYTHVALIYKQDAPPTLLFLPLYHLQFACDLPMPNAEITKHHRHPHPLYLAAIVTIMEITEQWFGRKKNPDRNFF